MSTMLPVFQRILVGVDRSDAARWASELAAGIAAATNGRAAVLHVIDIGKGFSPSFARPSATELLDRAAATFSSAFRVERLIREGDPGKEIVSAAKEWGADLIVIGTHGHGRIACLLLGSTADMVVRSADCPVLTVGNDPSVVEASREPTVTQFVS